MDHGLLPGPVGRVGHYRLLEEIGRGGMGVVYRARDEHLQREVALKLLPSGAIADDSTRLRLRKEALGLARVNHPNIETLYGFESAGDLDFLVVEYVRGVTLAARLLAGPLREPEIVDIGLQLASALEEAHAQGVVHRDLKPGNVIVTAGGQVKVLDFGLARLLPLPDATTVGGLTDAPAAAGTLPYVSPEQLCGSQPDQRCDLYALGVVLYEMAAGRPPYQHAAVGALVAAILHQEAPPVRSVNPEVSVELQAIVHKAIEKDAALRYQNAHDVKVDLQRLKAGRTAAPRPAPHPRPAGARRWRPWAAGVLLALLLGGYYAGRRASHGPGRGEQRKVLAVLPFEAVGGSRENEALCRGLTDLLTAHLAQVSQAYGVEVVPASEVKKEGVSSATDARRKLGVNLIVEGSWNFAGGNQIVFDVVDAQSRRELNAQVINADLSNLWSSERDVVSGLLRMLEVQLHPQQDAPDLPAHPDAYQYYVRGRGYLLDYQNGDSLRSAVVLFQRALDVDPRFALAYAGLGEAYWRQFEATRDQTQVQRAIDASRRAAELDGRLAPVRTTLGLVYQGTGRYQEAAAEFQRALESDATSDAAARGLASAYEAMGRTAEAEDTYKRAIAIRRDYWGGYSSLGQLYFKLGRYADAAAQFRRVIDLAPENVRGYTNLGAVYAAQARYADAAAQFQKAVSIQPDYRAYSNLGYVYFSLGRYGDAARVYESAVKLNAHDYRPWLYLADAYDRAPGEPGRARQAFEKAAALIEQQRAVNARDITLVTDLADCYSMLGRTSEALALLRRTLASAPDAHQMFRAAEIYTQAGDRDAALVWLTKAIRGGYPVSDVRLDPTFTPLRDDARYKRLLEPALSRSVPKR